MYFRLLGLIACFYTLAALPAQAQQLRGEASYYADKFHGRPTATGEKYDKKALTAANKDFPVGSILRVTRTDDGKTVDVRVNDCGPHRKGRIIDLSKAAAEKIGLVRDGVAEVQLKLIALGQDGFACGDDSPRPALTTLEEMVEAAPDAGAIPVVGYTVPVADMKPQPTAGRFWVQFGAYKLLPNAQTQYEIIRKSGLENLQIVKDGDLHRIVAGPYSDRFSAEALKYYLEREKKVKGMVTAL